MMNIIQKVFDLICIVIFLAVSLLSILYIIGIKPFIMITGSMEPTIPVGSICFIDTKYSYQLLEKEDIIMYQAVNQKIIHRIVEKRDGIYKTKGDAKEKIDVVDITPSIYLGKYIFSIKKVGFLTSRIDNSKEKIIFLVVIISIYIIDYLIHCKNRQKNAKY